MKIVRFEDMEVWQLARELVKLIYLVTREEPFAKDFRLCSQIQSAAVSVMTNIAEGFERQSKKEFIRFLYIAKASCGEVRSLNYVASDIAYVNNEISEKINADASLISKSISGFIKYLGD